MKSVDSKVTKMTDSNGTYEGIQAREAQIAQAHRRRVADALESSRKANEKPQYGKPV